MVLCRLCLEESERNQQIFKGKKINNFLIKHLNLELKENDPVSSIICNECWGILKDFNNFYIKIEKAQSRYSEILKMLLMVNENITSIKEEEPIENFETEEKEQIIKFQHISEEQLITDKIKTEFNDECLLKIKYENENETETETETKTNMHGTKNEIGKSNRNRKRVSKSAFLNNEEIDKKIASFMTLSCDICGKILPNLATLKIHFKIEHNTVGYIICCNKKFTQNHFLVGHIDNHLNPQNYKCIECNKVLSTQKNFDKHMSAKHFHKQWFKCDNCPRKFDSLNLLERHKPIHWPKEQWILKCSHCERTYPSEHFLKAHIVDIHERKNICQHCGKSFSARKFKQHQRSHTEDPDNLRVQCEICGAWLKTANGYRTHKKNHKDANAIHKCELCGKISPNRSALKIHLKNHDTTRNHQCTVCDKAFKRPLALRQHMATHTGEFLYQCAYCSKTFIYDSAYHTHKKRDHPNEYEIERKKIRRTDFTKFSNINNLKEQNTNIEENRSSGVIC